MTYIFPTEFSKQMGNLLVGFEHQQVERFLENFYFYCFTIMGDRHRPNTDGFLYPSILLTKTLISKGVTIPSGDCDRADLLICSNNMVVATVMMVLVASCEYIQIYIYTHSFMTCLHCFQSLVTSWDETGRSSPKQLSLRQERTVSLPEDALELSKVEDLWTC